MTVEPPVAALSSFELFAAQYAITGQNANHWDPAADSADEPPAARPEPDRRPPGGRESLAGLPFTVRAVLQLAPDLDIPTPDMVYTALWAPAVAADMQLRDSPVAYLSRETLAGATGMQGPKLMQPGGVVERAATTVGIVRMVTRGVPGAVPLEEGEGWRGQATSWTITGPLDGFTHTPARTGPTPRVVATGLPLQDLEIDPAAMAVWLNPLHPWWGPQAAGATGMRAIAALITRYGWTDLLLSATDVAALLGVHRQTAWRVLSALADIGAAEREGKRGRWRVRLASRLGRLTADDVKYDQRRPPPPSAARAKIHDWGWFSCEGRSVRARARSIVAEAMRGWDFPGDELRLDARTGRPWGVVIWVIEQLRHYVKRGEDAARALLGPFIEHLSIGTTGTLPAPHRRSTGPRRATPAPAAPAVAPDPAVPQPRAAEESAPAVAPEPDDGPMIDGFPVDRFGRPDTGRMSVAMMLEFMQRYPRGFPAHLSRSDPFSGGTRPSEPPQAATGAPGGVPGARAAGTGALAPGT